MVAPTMRTKAKWARPLDYQPRPGSSKGKIGKTKVIGARRAFSDFRFLISTLRQLIARGGKGDTKELQRAYKSVRTAMTARGGKF